MTHICWSLSQTQGHSTAGRINLMKNLKDPIGNRKRGPPALSTVTDSTNCDTAHAVYYGNVV